MKIYLLKTRLLLSLLLGVMLFVACGADEPDLSVADTDTTSVNVGDAVSVDVGDAVSVDVGDAVSVDVGEAVSVDVGDAVSVDVGEAVSVDVGDAVSVDVGDAVSVNVGDDVSVDVSSEESAEVEVHLSDINIITDLSIFSSYHLAMNIESINNESGDTRLVTQVSQTRSNAPAAYVIQVQFDNEEMMEEQLGNMMMVSLADSTYMYIPNMGCISTPGNTLGDVPVAKLIDPDMFINELERMQRVLPNEVINNVESVHYIFDNTYYLNNTEFTDNASEVSGHLYIAKDGDYIVRMVLTGNGMMMFDEEVATDMLDSEDSFRIEYNVSHVNKHIEVAMPEECTLDATMAGAVSVSVTGDNGGVEVIVMGEGSDGSGATSATVDADGVEVIVTGEGDDGAGSTDVTVDDGGVEVIVTGEGDDGSGTTDVTVDDGGVEVIVTGEGDDESGSIKVSVGDGGVDVQITPGQP